MSKRDYYEVLLVAKDSSDDEIKRSYRKLALKYHPDRNQGDADAEAKFKEATEAYSVLSDSDKRAAYDRYGHAGVQGGGFDFQNAGMGDILSQFQDMFADFFGGFGGGGGGRRGPERGQDIRIDARVSFTEAYTGTKKEVRVVGAAPCETCDGSGAEKGSKPERCPQCNGQGQVTTQRGFIMFSTTCPRCRGAGVHITNPCKTCRGGGAVEKERKVLVTFPPGVDSGVRMRVPGQGMPGPPNSQAGDLYVDVEVQEDDRYQRDAFDLIAHERVTFAQAVLGATITVELPDGETLEVEMPAGTQPGSVLTVRDKGFTRLDRRGRGRLHVVADVHVPKKLSRKAKKLLGELDNELQTAISKAKKRAG